MGRTGSSSTRSFNSRISKDIPSHSCSAFWWTVSRASAMVLGFLKRVCPSVQFSVVLRPVCFGGHWGQNRHIFHRVLRAGQDSAVHPHRINRRGIAPASVEQMRPAALNVVAGIPVEWVAVLASSPPSECPTSFTLFMPSRPTESTEKRPIAFERDGVVATASGEHRSAERAVCQASSGGRR